ncbi:hypothetical protein WDU94_009023 [Cyamophila willieti]
MTETTMIVQQSPQMASENYDFDNTIRAYPRDAQMPRLTFVRNRQGLPVQGRDRLKKLVKKELRIGTLNVGTMTGRGREIADLMARRRIEILCVQETRWKGDKAKELGDGYKLYYSGSNASGRNGVGIILENDLKSKVTSVVRKSDRVMSMKLQLDDMELNILSTYAPQVGCEDEEKDAFWREVEEAVSDIPEDERIFLAGDLNGHIGKGNTETTERIRGIWGVGDQNEEGDRIVDFALASDMAILNTFFKKNEKQLLTYKSGERTSQIDFILARRKHIKEVKNCKVINGEAVTPQHRTLVIDVTFMMNKKKVTKFTTPKIKWWQLKDPFLNLEFKRHVIHKIKNSSCQDLWTNYKEAIIGVGETVLGKTSGKGRPKDKETWWWNEEVAKCIKEKKEAKKKWDRSNQSEDKVEYKKAKKESKRAVAQAKARELDKIYKELETPEGEKNLYRLAKERNRATKDFTHIMQIKSKDGVVLKGEEDIKNRWKEYFNTLLNEENPRLPTEESLPNQGMTRDIERTEVYEALHAMKKGKATGPDNIPIEVWKSLGPDGLDLLTPLMNQVFQGERIPEDWRESIIVPIYKEKGDIQDCANYRGIKLMSHTMKLYERIIDKRLRKETCISENQFGFMPGRGTMDAVFAIRQLLEKYLEREKSLYLVFIDLEKAYDRVPRDEIWRLFEDCRSSREVCTCDSGYV